MKPQIKRGLIVGAILTLSFLAIGILTFSLWIFKMDREWSPLIEPRIKELQQRGSVRVLALDAKGDSRWVGSFTGGRLEERQPLSLKEIPTQLIQAIVVLEDPRFLEHGGFDIWGIVRAALVNLRKLRFSQGGSTLTQQLVKNVFLTHEKTISRKLTELVLAALLEKRFSKDEILQSYLNEVYLGQLGSVEIHGVGRSAEYYFGKPLAHLELAEVALVAALINSPGLYSPWKNPDRALTRRNKVLKIMLDRGLILADEHDRAVAAPLPGPTQYLAATRATYLMDAVGKKLREDYDEVTLLKGGFDLTLSLDLELQLLVEKTLIGLSAGWNPKQQAVLVAADPRTCEIKAYSGGTNYRLTQLDRIQQSKRPIGSLMKPLEVSGLLNDRDRGINLAKNLIDQPLTWEYNRAQTQWKPLNYDLKFRGNVSLRSVLEQSLNVPLARLFYELAPDGNLVDLLDPVRALGLDIPPHRALPSAVLGAIEQSPWSVLQAYVKFARQAMGMAQDAGDFACALHFDLKQDKNTEEELPTDPYQMIGARLTMAALEGALRRGTSVALGKLLPSDQAWAGKTGTSSDKRDAWYVALSPELVVLGWVGRDDNLETEFTGASGPLPFVLPLVLEASRRRQSLESSAFSWPLGDDLVWRLIDAKDFCMIGTGIIGGPDSPKQSTPVPEVFEWNSRQVYWELFDKKNVPEECKN